MVLGFAFKIVLLGWSFILCTNDVDTIFFIFSNIITFIIIFIIIIWPFYLFTLVFNLFLCNE